MVCAIEESKDLDSMIVEQLEGSLQAHEEKIKRRQEVSLEQLLKLRHPLRIMEVKRANEGIGEDEAIAVMKEEQVMVTTSTMKLKSTKHSEVVVVDKEEEEDVDTTKKIMDKGMTNQKLNVIMVINLAITLGNVVAMLNKRLTLLTTRKKKMSHRC